jgi:hypothetical protein
VAAQSQSVVVRIVPRMPLSNDDIGRNSEYDPARAKYACLPCLRPLTRPGCGGEITASGDHPKRVYLRVSDTVIEWVRLPLVPVIVSLYVPLGDPPEVDTLNVALVPVVDAGVKAAVALAGNPVTVNATDPVNP